MFFAFAKQGMVHSHLFFLRLYIFRMNSKLALLQHVFIVNENMKRN